MEEGTELLSRLKLFAKGGKVSLPMVTSCSPGWIKYIEHTFPEMLPHLSTCKSPHMMTGAIIKTYYAQRLGIAPEDMFVVSVMPCTAKKFEITRAEMMNYGLRNVDAVLTTRELGEMINSAGIDFANLPDSKFHDPLGFSTGAADIFGFSGGVGVMEAALRTAYEVITGRELPGDNLHVTPIIGLEDVKEASILIESPLPEYSGLDGVELKVAVTSGTKNAKTLMKQVKEGNSPTISSRLWDAPAGASSAADSRAAQTAKSGKNGAARSCGRTNTKSCARATKIRRSWLSTASFWESPTDL